MIGLESLTSGAWLVEVTNNSGEVAKDVRLIIPGSGKADISVRPLGSFDLSKSAVDWKQEIPLGSIPPNGRVQLLVWPDESLFLTFFGVNAGVVHDKGSGVVREAHEFFGWDADLVAWFLGQTAVTRYSLGLLALAILIAPVWLLRRRGYVVSRRGEGDAPAATTDSP